MFLVRSIVSRISNGRDDKSRSLLRPIRPPNRRDARNGNKWCLSGGDDDVAGTYALLSTSAVKTAIEFRVAMDSAVSRTDWLMREPQVESMRSILYRALAMAELKAPTGVQGAFIAAGNSFDALSAVTKVLGPASKSVLVVDPYMDEKTLTDFVPLTNEGVQIRLLSDARTVKPSLKPAVTRWQSQYGTTRPLEARLAPSAALHDRLMIIDDDTVWVLTQSLNAFANRAPASIVRVDQETAALKLPLTAILGRRPLWSPSAPANAA